MLNNHDAFETAIVTAVVTISKDPICRSIHHLPWLMDVITPQLKQSYSLDYDGRYDFHYADLPIPIIATS